MKALRKLRKLNFEKLISVGVSDVTTYSFDECKNNGYKHPCINGYCISCEKKGYNHSKDDSSYKLTNISHGAHSSDFFQALNEEKDVSNWHEEPIIFVYESPSGSNCKHYKKVPYKGYNKHPSKDWYGINHDQDFTTYPQGFKRSEYGKFILSAMGTFKLANVYMTNLVKCGLNNAERQFKVLAHFKDETIKNCFSSFLKQEISILKPKIIFAMGSAVECWVKHFVNDTYYVQQLPHPAARSFRNDHIKVIYFWGVARALHKAGIIDTDEVCELTKLYLNNYEPLAQSNV